MPFARRVMVAHGGNEAIALARHARPDLIICDLFRSDFSALDLRRRMIADPHLAHIPFIVISAERAKEAQLQALRLGAADYLLKPIAFDTLFARLVHFLESRKVRTVIDAALSGPLDMLHCPTLLQMLEWNRSTGILQLSGPNLVGHFAFKEGLVVDVYTNDLTGEDAAFELIALEQGVFVFDAKPAADIPGPYHYWVQSLLMDASWIRDEIGRLGHAVPQDNDLIEVVDPQRAQDCFIHPAWKTFLASGTQRSVLAIAELVDIGHKRARVMIGDAIASGALRVVGRDTIDLPAILAPLNRSPAGSRPSIGRGARVVIIDDDREVHRGIAPFLEAAGFEVHTHDSGEGAAEIVRALSPAVVIVDGVLPGVLGPEVCKAIRKGPPPNNVPIIFLSAYFKDAAAHRHLRDECGANIISHKTCDSRIIVDQVIALFEKSQRDGNELNSIELMLERVRELDEGIALLKQRYRERIPEKIQTLRHTVESWTKGHRRPLLVEAHKLRGSAGMYGFPEASKLLGVLEEKALEGGAIGAADLVRLIDQIDTAFHMAPPGNGATAIPHPPSSTPAMPIRSTSATG
jgi:DNA-binding response OmpR family regulator